MKGTFILLFICASIALSLKLNERLTYLENEINAETGVNADSNKRAFTVTDLHQLSRLQATTFSKDIDGFKILCSSKSIMETKAR